MGVERRSRRLDATGERRFTDRLKALFARDDPTVELGIGDDAAVVAPAHDRLVACCDPVVVGVHCAPDAKPAAIAHKAVARNLSDLAAMGATPRHLLVAVLVPKDLGRPPLDALMRGLARAARRFGVTIVGGDVGSTPGPWTVVVTALGEISGRPLRRDGLAVGDALHVTGPLGGSILGRHLRFEPRIAAGLALAASDAVSACMDVSDGLVLDLWTMLRASGCPGADIDAAALPVHADARRLARQDGTPALDHALFDGEDHELLFGVRGRAAVPTGLGAVAGRPIGRVSATPGIRLVTNDGVRTLDVRGYQHRV